MSLRTTRLTSLLTRAAARAPSTTLRPFLGASALSVQIPSQSSRQTQPFPLPISNQVQTRGYALGATTGKSQADLLVDELQELYPSPILIIPLSLPAPNKTALTPNKGTKLQKTNSKSQPTAPTTPPSTPPPTVNPAATP